MTWLVIMLSAFTAEVSVHVTGDDPCRLRARIAPALQSRNPGAADAGSMVLRVEPRADQLRVTLTSTRGETLLHRTVPNHPRACAATADGVVLVLETWFDDLGWTAGPSATRGPLATPGEGPAGEAPSAAESAARPDPPASAEQPASGSRSAAEGGPLAAPTEAITTRPEARPASASTAEAPASDVRVGAPGSPRRKANFGVALGLRGLSEVVPTPRFGGVVEAQVVYQAWTFGLELGALSTENTDIQRDTDTVGRVEVRSVYAVGGPYRCTLLGPGQACAGLRGGVEILFGTSVGEGIFGSATDRSSSLVQPLIAPGLRYNLVISNDFSLIAVVDGLIRPQQSGFAVGGGTAHASPLLAGTFAIGAQMRIY